MRRILRILAATLCGITWFAVVAPRATAQGGGCMLSGQRYPENASVCSGGLVQFCTNGVWQNNDGARCDGDSGSYVGSRRPLAERNAEQIPDHYKKENPGLNLQ
jgi:hypothetical protein